MAESAGIPKRQTGTSVPASAALQETGIISTGASTTRVPSKSQADAGYRKQSKDNQKRCVLCEHYQAAGLCELVLPEPNPIAEDSVCDLFVAQQVEVDMTMPDMQMQEMQVVREQADGKGYIYLAVRAIWEVERLQSALYQLFGYDEGWKWIDAYALHVTLVYSPNISDEQLLEAAKALIDKPAIRLKFSGIGTFASDEDHAVYLKVDENSDLRDLQRGLYDSLAAQGVEMSAFSQPDAWVPHMTVCYTSPTVTVPESPLDIEVYTDEVVLGRDNWHSLAKMNLKWDFAPESDRGDSPVLEMASWKCGAATDLAVMDDSDWSGSKAAKSIFEQADFGGDNPDTTFARKGFLIYDASAPTLRTSYKLPFAKVVDGELKASSAGIRAAASRLPQTDASDAALKKAQKVLDGYKKKAGIGEMQEIRLTMISEMSAGYPDVPLPADIDTAELENVFGEKPFFVTLPIGQIDAMSGNGRRYSKAAVQQMVTQINAMRPEGIWGHMKEDELNTRYDPPSIRWLAAMLDGTGVAWGKGLPLNKETRDYYRASKAANARVGTSLTGLAEINDNVVTALDLRGIDIADPARVGIAMTAAKPQLTSEMGDVYVRAKPESPVVDAPVIPSTEDVRGAPEGTGETLSEMNEENLMAELQIAEQLEQEKLNNVQLQAKITELEAQAGEIPELKQHNEDLRKQVGVMLGEHVKTAAAKACKVDLSRDGAEDDYALGVVMELVSFAQPQSVDEVNAKVAEVMQRPMIVEMMKAKLAKQAPPVETLPSEAVKPKLFEIPTSNSASNPAKEA